MKRQTFVKAGLLVFIVIGFCITRFWQLTTLPNGIHIDEAGMAYDAWCLAHYGVDRLLKSWPVYLTNFGGGQSALYAYLCAACIKIFGFSIWSIRLPGVFSSFLALIFGMKTAEKMFPLNTYLPYAVGGLAVVCPYFIMASRFGLDCNLALGFSAMFLYLFISALDNGKTGYYVLAGLAGGIVLYTYALTYVVVPLFLLLSFCYLLWTKRLLLRKWAIMAVPLGILAFPLIWVQAVNFFDLDEASFWVFTITKLDIYRVSEMEGAKWEYFVNALTSIFCSDSLPYNTVPGGYALYRISIALFILGACYAMGRFFISLRERQFDVSCFTIFWILSILYFESHLVANANKMNAVFLAIILLVAEGIRVIGSVKGYLRYILPGLVCAAYLVCFIYFSRYYYGGEYTAKTHPLPYFDTMVAEAVEFVDADGELSQRKTYMAESFAYYLISVLPSPYELETVNDPVNYENFFFHQLGAMKEDCNYIVRDIYPEYKEELRQAGFQEIEYQGYSLFYRR